jgi:DNA-binding CsgD family transcriptional regulator
MAVAQIEERDVALTGNVQIRGMLLRRARQRSRSSIKWNISSLMFAYVVMASTIIVALRVENDLLVALVAILGLVVVAAFSSLQAKKLEAEFFREEIKDYVGLLSAQPGWQEPTQPSALGQAALPISGRELDVLKQVAGGKSNKETATALGISEQTVKNHLRHAFEKMDVTDRTSAILLAMRKGWIDINGRGSQGRTS